MGLGAIGICVEVNGDDDGGGDDDSTGWNDDGAGIMIFVLTLMKQCVIICLFVNGQMKVV